MAINKISTTNYAAEQMESAHVAQVLVYNSSNKMLPNFRYVYRVSYITPNGNTIYIGEFQYTPQGSDNYGYLDISSILKNAIPDNDFLNNFFIVSNRLETNYNKSVIVNFKIEVLEFDGVNIGSVLFTDNGFLWNGLPNFINPLESNKLFTRVCNTSQQAFAMSSYNGKKKKIYTSETSASLVPVLSPKYYTNNSSQPISFTAIDINGNAIITTSNLINFIIPLETRCIIYLGGTNYYKIVTNNATLPTILQDNYRMSLTNLLTTDTIDIYKKCKPFIELYYKNRFGAMEQIIFDYYKLSNQLSKKEFKRQNNTNSFVDAFQSFAITNPTISGNIGYTQNRLSTKNYSTQVMPTMQLVRQVEDIQEYYSFMEFMQSNEVYIAVPIANSNTSNTSTIYTHNYIPIQIQDTNVSLWKPEQEKATLAICNIILPSYKPQSN
jgi:hypothetical protein